MKDIKFRAWDVARSVMHQNTGSELNPLYLLSQGALRDTEFVFMQFTGLFDKHGKEIYEHDVIGVQHKIGDNADHYTHAAYRVFIDPKYGIELRYLKNIGKDENNNQYPVHQTLNFKYGSLTEAYVSQKYDRIAVADTHGENYMFGHTWRQNHYSEDVEVIGNIYENPELLGDR